MSGIYGYAGFQEAGLLERMSRVLRHRGPEGGHWVAGEDGRGPAMGQRGGAEGAAGQVVVAQDGLVAVVCSGAIYNREELAAELEAGQSWVWGRTAPEVLVRGYERWGLPGLLGRLNGMFAFCLSDGRSGDLFLARDRLGQQPLYYTETGGRFLFASEVKALLQSAHVEARPNIRAIDPYLMLGHVPGPQTMFAGIYTLPAAHFLRHGANGTVEVKRWWQLPVRCEGGAQPQGDDGSLQELEALWEDAVGRCAASDGSIGVYLDGGVESALTAAMVARLGVELRTYGIAFGSSGSGPSVVAERAKVLGARHREVVMMAEEFTQLPEVIWHLDRPVGDAAILGFYGLARGVASEVGVMLGGEAMDEGVSGRQARRILHRVEQYHRLMPRALHHGAVLPGIGLTPWALLRLASSLPATFGIQGKRRWQEFLKNYDRRDPGRNEAALRMVWALDERRTVYADEFKSLATEAWMGQEEERADHGAAWGDRLFKASHGHWLQDWALLRQDKNSMAHGLECRLPALDHRLAERAMTLPLHLRVNGRASQALEKRLADRLLPKGMSLRSGPPVRLPAAFYFDHPEFRTLVADTLNAEQLKKRGYFHPKRVAALIETMNTTRDGYLCRQVMSLVSLELWHRVFVDRQYGFGAV